MTPPDDDQLPLIDTPTDARAQTMVERLHASGAWGYATQPGTGPNGETCRTCRYPVAVEYSGRYLKCGHPVARAKWTRGIRTDIRLYAPACRHWEAKS